MASGFLLAEALAEALRRPYHQGDLDVTVQYLVEGLSIGEYRVLLKRNFDTACWIPPVGRRGSHTIYYGDRMVAHIIDRFCRVNEVELPAVSVFAEEIKTKLEKKRDALIARGKKVAADFTKPTRSAVYEAKVAWVKDNLPKVLWDVLLEVIRKAVGAFGRHERSHARETPKDMKQVNRDLRTLGIPFKLYNLFEDARIEHISRREIGGRFDWLGFEDPGPLSDPYALFFRCIQLEGEPDTEALDSEDPYGDGTRTMGHVADSVQSYYRRACDCAHAEHLYPIITEFLEEFRGDLKERLPEEGEEGEEGEGKPGSGSGKGKGKGSKPGESSEEGEGEGSESSSGSSGGADEEDDEANDLSLAAEAADKGDDFFEDFEKDAEVVGGTDAEGKAAEAKAKEKLKGEGASPEGKGTGGMGSPGSVAPSASGGRATEADFLVTKAGKVDNAYAKRVDALTQMLMRMFKSHSLMAATENPGQRMSSRHLAHGELRFLHRKVYGGKGKRRYSIVYDCSGSMNGRPDREGKLLLLALNNLAKRGYLEGSLILTGYPHGAPGWLQYEFPVADHIILRIQTNHGSEGIQYALKDNLKHIKGMDDVFVYTDSNICDAPLNRAFFAKHRIWPVGLYVGRVENATQMEEHFPQNIIRHTIEEVVEAMLTRNRRTVG
ncbi:hypothetical protein [Burkholderia ambifaria]|uniref:hypothetical protein n=1 Tax=Burkholderia ambifaria TaxID=152480 RepID=UPI000F7FB77B|nr:hypothetical protein [Burkholderia ambifaria]